MTNDPSFDLASIDTWCGLRPGMSRAQVLEALKERGEEAKEYGTDSLTVTSDEWEMDLDFTTDGTDRLWQLAVCGEAVLWNGQKLQDAKLDDIMRILGSPAGAVWQSVNDDPSPISPDSTVLSLPTDEELLEDGTFWLPERGLGIAVFQGEFMDAAWRATKDLPGRFAGPVTEAQRQLSKQADLETRLQEKRDERFKTEPKKRDPLSPIRTLVKIAAIAAIAFVAKLGFDDMQVWNHAPTLQAKFVAIEQLPMKQFRDFLPPALRWVFPHTKDVIVEHYRVEFTPPGEDQPRQAVLERGELYVPPRNPGDEVPVAYAVGDPPRTMGLSRASNSAFVQYVPWVIAIGALWLIADFGIALLPALFRAVRQSAKYLPASSEAKDPDRPELR